MKNYLVVWRRSAEDDLAELWLNATDRAEITSAVQTIELRLAESPSEWGEELSEGMRALRLGSLRVLFDISETGRRVRVVSIVRIAPHGEAGNDAKG